MSSPNLRLSWPDRTSRHTNWTAGMSRSYKRDARSKDRIFSVADVCNRGISTTSRSTCLRLSGFLPSQKTRQPPQVTSALSDGFRVGRDFRGTRDSDRTTRTERPGPNGPDKTARTNGPDRTARTERPGQTARTERPGQNRPDKTART